MLAEKFLAELGMCHKHKNYMLITVNQQTTTINQKDKLFLYHGVIF